MGLPFENILLYFWFKYDLRQKYYAPQVWPDRGSNWGPSDHDSTFHVTEMPVLTTRPSVTSYTKTRVYPRLWSSIPTYVMHRSARQTSHFLFFDQFKSNVYLVNITDEFLLWENITTHHLMSRTTFLLMWCLQILLFGLRDSLVQRRSAECQIICEDNG